MDMHYSCSYMQVKDKLVLHLENHKNDRCITDATLSMQAQPLTRRKLFSCVLFQPYMSARVYYGIYKQALGLFLKKNPLYTNPTTDRGTQNDNSEDISKNEFIH